MFEAIIICVHSKRDRGSEICCMSHNWKDRGIELSALILNSGFVFKTPELSSRYMFLGFKHSACEATCLGLYEDVPIMKRSYDIQLSGVTLFFF